MQPEIEFISTSRHTLKEILAGRDQRLVLIVGPCSIHDEESTYEYASKFLELSRQVSSQFFMIMRCYFEKPRTKNGWKGLINDPDLDGSHDIEKGIFLARKILTTLSKLNIPTGSELLELTTASFFSDLLTWGCIGARTVESQPHRQLASSFDFPIGFKNTTDGNIDIALHAILASNQPHTYLGVDKNGKLTKVSTKGNPHGHLVLRGGCRGPNYDRDSLQWILKKSESHDIAQRILIDCSHGNSQKNEQSQKRVFDSVLAQYLEGNLKILGMMLESHLIAGSQALHFPLKYGVSVTDPCLDFDSTEELILRAAEKLDSQKCYSL